MDRVLNFVLRGRAEGIDAMFNRMNRGLSSSESGFRRNTQQAGIFTKQLNAMATTARYALSGSLVFGITGAIGKLNDLQKSLGAIDVVATRPGGIEGLGNQMTKLRNGIIKTSIDTTAPLKDLTASIANIYSSLSQDLPVQDVVKLAGAVSKIATTGGITNQRLLVGSLLGGASAFGLSEAPGQIDKSVQKIGDVQQYILNKSRNISGEEFTQYSGNLFQSAGLAGLSLPETATLAIEASKFGGTASAILPNLNQLLANIRKASTKKNQSAYNEAGITQQDLLAPDTFPAIMKILNHAKNLGVQTNGQPLTDDNIDQPGAVSGAGAEFLQRVFGRQQSRRIASVLVANLDDFNNQLKGAADSAGEVERALKRYQAQVPLQRAGIALSAAGTQFMLDASPVLNVGARGIAAGTGYLATHHAAREAIELALGVGAAGLGVRKFRSIGGGAKGLAGAGIIAEQAGNLLSGGATDGTMANPYWVVISPASWALGGPSGTGTTTPGESFFKKVTNKFPAAAALGARFAGPAALATGLLYAEQHTVKGAIEGSTFLKGLPGGKYTKGDLQNDIGKLFHTITGTGSSPAIDSALQFAHMRRGDVSKIEVEGTAKTDVTVRLTDKDGRVVSVTEHKGIPTKLQTAKQPSSRGKKSDRRVRPGFTGAG